MATCKNCGKPLILNGGKCVYCGKTVDEHMLNGSDNTSGAGLPPIRTFTINGVSFNMILVEGGTFWMGAQYTNPQGQNYDLEASHVVIPEEPVHEVTLSSYYLGETVVTQALVRKVWPDCVLHWGGKWRDGKGGNHPAYNISWDNWKYFIQKLNEITKQRFRMPTEAEWEYAARGGNRSRNTKYSGSDTLDDVGWYWKNSGNKVLLGTEEDMDWRKMRANKCRIHAVKEKRPNEIGLYDMSGNVWECCMDYMGAYQSRHQADPWGPYSGEQHVIRGGCWYRQSYDCRVSTRGDVIPHSDWQGGFGTFGLRLCLPC